MKYLNITALLLVFLLLPISFLSAQKSDTLFVTLESFANEKANEALKSRCCDGSPTEIIKTTHKSITYQQTRTERFSELYFDKAYSVQYGVLSDVSSMPRNSVAYSFYTNEKEMYLIVSERNFKTYAEAIAEGEKVKQENSLFECFMVKECIVPKSAQIIAEREALRGRYRIQHNYTKNYPSYVLPDFTVEAYKDGFRQVSNKAFDTKEKAIAWVQETDKPSKEYIVYTIE